MGPISGPSLRCVPLHPTAEGTALGIGLAGHGSPVKKDMVPVLDEMKLCLSGRGAGRAWTERAAAPWVVWRSDASSVPSLMFPGACVDRHRDARASR